VADQIFAWPSNCGAAHNSAVVPHLYRCAVSCPAADNEGTPIRIANATNGQLAYEGDRFRPVLEAIDATVTDTQGRPYPGNPLLAQGQQISQCYDENEVHLIRITDSCPCTQVGAHAHGHAQAAASPDLGIGERVKMTCRLHSATWRFDGGRCGCCIHESVTHCAGAADLAAAGDVLQVLKEGAPGVAAGGETRTQSWCCAAKGLQHFDISYWAMEKLVRPVFGEQGGRICLDCVLQQTLDPRRILACSAVVHPKGVHAVSPATGTPGAPQPHWQYT
jgi:hypothetical protein